MYNFKPILLVEDDDVDVMTIRRAFKDLQVTNNLIHKVDGREAIEYLRDENNQKPCLILLDLNMPRMNGFEFIEIVKADNNLKRIPVVVLTTSSTNQDIAESFNLNVAGYIVKPIVYKSFLETMKVFDAYWTLSVLPNNP